MQEKKKIDNIKEWIEMDFNRMIKAAGSIIQSAVKGNIRSGYRKSNREKYLREVRVVKVMTKKDKT